MPRPLPSRALRSRTAPRTPHRAPPASEPVGLATARRSSKRVRRCVSTSTRSTFPGLVLQTLQSRTVRARKSLTLPFTMMAFTSTAQRRTATFQEPGTLEVQAAASTQPALPSPIPSAAPLPTLADITCRSAKGSAPRTPSALTRLPRSAAPMIVPAGEQTPARRVQTVLASRSMTTSRAAIRLPARTSATTPPVPAA